MSFSECSLWFQSSGYSCALSCGSVHSCGCVVLFRPSLSLVNSWSDGVGRYLQCEFVFCGKSFRVCCIYAPNRNPARDQFFNDLRVKVDPSVPTMLCGDFNAVFDRSVDRFGSDPSDLSRESFSSLRDLFDACCTVDTRWDGSRASRIDLCGIPCGMTFGRHGAPRSSVSPRWRNGGTRGRVALRGSLFAIVAQGQLLGPVIGISLCVLLII